jgi:hypothetical protein
VAGSYKRDNGISGLYIAGNFLITWGITMLACQAKLCSI